jgi:hypothetical protein
MQKITMSRKIHARLLALLAAVAILGSGATSAFALSKISSLETGSATGVNAKAITAGNNVYNSTVYFMPNAAKDAVVTVGLKFTLDSAAKSDDSIRIVDKSSTNVTDLKFSDPGEKLGNGGNVTLDSSNQFLVLKNGNAGADNVKLTFKVTKNDLASGGSKAVIAFQYYDAGGNADADSQLRLTLNVMPVPSLSVDPAVCTADMSELNGKPVSLTIKGADAAAKAMLLKSNVAWYKGPHNSGGAIKIDNTKNAITRPAAAAVSVTAPGDTGLRYGSDVLDNPELIFSTQGKGPKGNYEYRLGVKSGDMFTYDETLPVGYVQAEGYTFAEAKVVITDKMTEVKFSSAAAGAPGVGEYHNGEVITHSAGLIETPVYYLADAGKPGRGTKIAFTVSGKSRSANEITSSVDGSGWAITTVDGKNGKIKPDASSFDYEDTIILTRTATGDLPEKVSINLSNTGAGGSLDETCVASLGLAALKVKGEPVSFEKGTAAVKASYFTADAGKWGKKHLAAKDVTALYIDGDSSGSDYIAASAADPLVSAYKFWGDAKAARIARDVDHTSGGEITGIALTTTAKTGTQANTFKAYLTRSSGSPFAVLEGDHTSNAVGYAYWSSSLLSMNIPFEAKVVETGSGGGGSGGGGSDSGGGSDVIGEIPAGPAQSVANVPAGNKITVGIDVVIPDKNVVTVAVDAKNAVIKELASQGVTVSARDNYVVIKGNPMPNINKTYYIPVIAALSDGTKLLVKIPLRISKDISWDEPNDNVWVIPDDDWYISDDRYNSGRSSRGCDTGFGAFALAAAAAALLSRRG